MLDIEKNKVAIEYFAQKGDKLFELILKKWKTLKEMIVVLQIANNATIALQNPRLTLSDAFGIWMKMKIHLDACAVQTMFKTKLAKYLSESLEERQNAIFKVPQMELSLFLDPRYRSYILKDRDAVDRAKAAATKIWLCIHGLNQNENVSNRSNNSIDLNFQFDANGALAKFLERGENAESIVPMETEHLSIEDEIEMFQPNSLPPEKSVLDFWETMKHSYPSLYIVAMAIYSISPTQVKIEQNFSSLSHILTNRRHRLSPETLQSILLIHLNKDLFYEIKEEEIAKLRNIN